MAWAYTTNRSVFLDFINRVDGKRIAIETIINLIEDIWNKNEIVISDIGAGNWIIASWIISSIQNKINYRYNFIEPSQDLINDFKEKSTSRNVIYFNKKLEQIDLLKSDIIIASFIFQTLSDARNILDTMYQKLNSWWTILIINQNKHNIDYKLKELFWYTFPDITQNIISQLDILGIHYTHEIKNWYFDWVDEILNLTQIWKNCLSFMLFKNFDSISNQELKMVLDFIKDNSVNWKLPRKEDYIYITKS